MESSCRPTDITIKEVRWDTEDYLYRTPIKFGGVVLNRVTLLHVQLEVISPQGRRAVGRGAMPLGNVWAFPSRSLTYDMTLGAMRELAAEIASIYLESKIAAHPLEITWQLETEILKSTHEVALRLGLHESIPELAALVTASPFDAALHDAFGKLHDRSVYQTYGRDFLDNDLGRFLGIEFRGVPIDQYVSQTPVSQLPLYHLVGALDPLFPEDVEQPVGDGLPESLFDWIKADGLTHLKIKLNGDDLTWDVERVLGVEAVTSAAYKRFGIVPGQFSLDFNEQCRSVTYLLEFLDRLAEDAPAAYGRIAYIEQPTRRDLRADHQNVMHAASSRIPVVIDEALIDLESLRLAREMGYTGAALKACKGQTQSILMAGAARQLGMSLCVQDLTCPGASLIHSAGLAAHVRGVSAIEANARQYCPAANQPWIARFPGVFVIRDGTMHLGDLQGKGLGAYE